MARCSFHSEEAINLLPYISFFNNHFILKEIQHFYSTPTLPIGSTGLVLVLLSGADRGEDRAYEAVQEC